MVKGSEIGKDVDDEGNMTMSDSVVIEASSGKKIGKTWKRKEIKVSKQKGELMNQVGQKRNVREVNVIGLDELEMEEMRIIKKVGIDTLSKLEGEIKLSAEQVAGPTDRALGGQ